MFRVGLQDANNNPIRETRNKKSDLGFSTSPPVNILSYKINHYVAYAPIYGIHFSQFFALYSASRLFPFGNKPFLGFFRKTCLDGRFLQDCFRLFHNFGPKKG